MAERSAITQLTQLGVESTPGTAVAANRLLPSLSLKPSPKFNINAFAGAGFKVNTLTALGKEWSEWKIEGIPTYDEIIYLLNSLLVVAAPVQQASTTAYKSTFAPSGVTEDTIKTFTAENGSAVRAAKAAQLTVNELTITGDREGVTVSGSAFARAITDGITLTSSPTAIAQIPILAKDATIYADDTSGGLGTTKLARALKWELKLGPRFEMLWPVDKSQASFAATVEKKIPATFTLTLEADAAGMAFLTTVRTNARKFVRLDIVSDLLAGTAIPYSFRADLAGNVSEVSDLQEEQEVIALAWTFDIEYDATWTKWLQVEVINKTSAL